MKRSKQPRDVNRQAAAVVREAIEDSEIREIHWPLLKRLGPPMTSVQTKKSPAARTS